MATFDGAIAEVGDDADCVTALLGADEIVVNCGDASEVDPGGTTDGGSG